MIRIILCVILAFVFVGCAVLEPVKHKTYADLSKYQYAIMSQSATLNSGAGYMGYGTDGGFGYSVSKSVNPSDIIAGILMDKGFVIIDVPQGDQTLIVKYGQGGRRDVAGGLGGYTLSVNIQMLDAQTQKLVFMCKAEGQGHTEADDLREAITRCLSAFRN